MASAIYVRNLRKSFSNVPVFQDFNLDIEREKITAIFGPNGSGKTTLLNILSGILAKDGGWFHIHNFDRFKFSYIFQNYRESLLPWRTNFENLALPLEIQRKSKKEIRERIEELQGLFDFKCDLQGYPYELSGGQQQILAFIRALVVNPKLLFIDEPFSALDYENNLRLREYLQKYFLKFQPTILLITHNIEEAAHLAEKIVVFSKKPAKVLETVNDSLQYPRILQTIKTEQFNRVKDEVLSVFQRAANL